jgi:glycosyltransferase involved in cell wall biosynthesis
LRIALTADPELPVPPRLYGGIERIVDMLAQGLEARGHEVTLFAHWESVTAGRLVSWPGRTSRDPLDTARNAAALAGTVLRGRFDLIHSFSRIAYLTPILPLNVPKLMTYQRDISPRTVRLGHALSRGTLSFSAISSWMMGPVKHIGRWSMIPNGVPLETYGFSSDVAADAPLVFLGRLEEIKGPHLAIEIARRTGAPLILAGNVPHAHRAWFESAVAPHIDGKRISYVGPVDDAQKSALLGQARALLMPILWEEPFGIVMAEAMACGAPVLGLARGAVPEVVEDGVTGFVRPEINGLVEAVGRLGEIDRAACRSRVEANYSDKAVVESYVSLYNSLL